MRPLGLVLLLFGLATIVLYFLGTNVEMLAWIGNWGEGVGWAIRCGSAVLGLLLLKAGKKGDKKK